MADVIWVVKNWRERINNRTYSIVGFIMFWIGMLLTFGGLFILVVNLLRH